MLKHCLFYVSNEHENVQSKVRVLKEITDSTECNINDSQNDIIKELIHVQTDAILLKEGACKSEPSDQKLIMARIKMKI